MKRLIWCLLTMSLVGIPAMGQTTFFLETWDVEVVPILPGDVLADASWKSSASSPSPGSGLNNAVHTGSSAGNLVLGPIDLSTATSAELSYWARRTSSYSADSLLVTAGDGSTFATTLFGGGLPVESSSWEQITVPIPSSLLGEPAIYLRFEGRGGSSSGSNIRIDDVAVSGSSDPSTLTPSFGFSSASSNWLLSSSTLEVPFDLLFPGPDSIQGFQFDLDYDTSLVQIDSLILGSGLSAGTSWSTAIAATTEGSRMALLNISSAVAPGSYKGALKAVVSLAGSEPTADSTIVLSIGELLVTSNTAHATEVDLYDGLRTHLLELEPASASIEWSDTSIDFGSLEAGQSGTVSVTVSNPTGPSDLVLNAAKTGALTLAAPPPIPAGATGLLTIIYAPNMSSGGIQSGEIEIEHNTAVGSTFIQWTALVLGGRGDVDADGSFDVVDVVSTLDASVASSPLSPTELARHDLHPFPSGNGLIDIRDVTVGIQAILRNQWPDGAPLPVSPSPGKGRQFNLYVREDGLWLDAHYPFRALQMELKSSQSIAMDQLGKISSSTSAWFDDALGIQRLILMAAPGNHFESGQIHLSSETPIDLLGVSGVVALIDDQGKAHVGLDESDWDTLPDRPVDWVSVYPNPVRLGEPVFIHRTGTALYDPLVVEVFDSTGRLLSTAVQRGRTLDTSSIRTPGLYLIRFQIAFAETDPTKKATTISIVVTR